jgi:hypothetical protein
MKYCKSCGEKSGYPVQAETTPVHSVIETLGGQCELCGEYEGETFDMVEPMDSITSQHEMGKAIGELRQPLQHERCDDILTAALLSHGEIALVEEYRKAKGDFWYS